MEIVLMTLLLVALVVAIYCDLVRIHQYKEMVFNKRYKNCFIRETVFKVNRMVEGWRKDKETKLDVLAWCVEHWDDEKYQ